MTCASCKKSILICFSDLDHKIPKFLGGDNGEKNSNLQRLCLDCHRAKSLFESIYLRPLKSAIQTIIKTVNEFGGGNVVSTQEDALNKILRVLVFDVDTHKCKKFIEQECLSKNTIKNSTKINCITNRFTNRFTSTAKKRSYTDISTKRWTHNEDQLLISILSSLYDNEAPAKVDLESIVYQYNTSSAYCRSKFALQKRSRKLLLNIHKNGHRNT